MDTTLIAATEPVLVVMVATEASVVTTVGAEVMEALVCSRPHPHRLSRLVLRPEQLLAMEAQGEDKLLGPILFKAIY